MGEAQITRWLYVFGRTTFGHSIFYDPVDPFPGRQRTYSAEVALQPSARFNQSVSYDRVEFDRLSDGRRVYTVNVLNTRTTFQIDRGFSARAIVQYDSSQHRVLTDFLASWELLPGHRGLRRLRLAHRAAGVGRRATSTGGGGATAPASAASSSRRPTSTGSDQDAGFTPILSQRARSASRLSSPGP